MKWFLYVALQVGAVCCVQNVRAMETKQAAAAEQPDLVAQLILAVNEGNTAGVAELIKMGVDVNAKRGGLAALSSASPSTPSLSYYIGSRAYHVFSVNKIDQAANEARRKLMTDEERKRFTEGRIDPLPVVRLLVDAGAYLNEVDYAGNTALSWAVKNFNIPLVTFLLESGADTTIYKDSDGTPFQLSEKDFIPVRSIKVQEEQLLTINKLIKDAYDAKQFRPHAITTLGRAVKPTEGHFSPALAGIVADYLGAEDIIALGKLTPEEKKAAADEPVPSRGDAKRR